jgi:hypothetical protein
MQRVILAIAAVVWLAPVRGSAWNPLGDAGHDLGQGLGKGAMEAIQPALASTVADVDTRLDRQVQSLGKVGEQLVSDLKGAVGGSVSQVLEDRLDQVDVLVASNLSRANSILERRTAQVNTLLEDRLAQADKVIEARIDQIDQTLAVRLGNVDVIATKQRLGFEQSLLRVAVLCGILVFVVYVLRTLWTEVSRVGPDVQATTRPARLLAYARHLAPRLVLQLVAAGLAIGVLAVLYDRLPFGSGAQARDLAAMHERELSASLARFDFARARYHAAQLEILVPEDSGRYQVVGTKTDMLRDLVLRPGLLVTPDGQSQLVSRLKALEGQLGKRADPDLLTMKALLVWQTGDGKDDEHQAASLCARALRLAPEGFPLAPLARHYIRMFLHAPYLAPGTPYGRDRESLADLRTFAAMPVAGESTFPLSPVLELDTEMARVDAAAGAAYLDMAAAQAQVEAALRRLRGVESGRTSGAVVAVAREPGADPSRELVEARARRGDAARRVVLAWRAFDRAIQRIVGLAGTSTVLAVFRLDDATFSRAAWFAAHPEANEPAPLLSELKDPRDREALAPPRVGWERRYAGVLAADVHGVAAFQEAARFQAFERDCRDFERLRARYEADPQAPDARHLDELAARLGLYVETAGALRAPFTAEPDERDCSSDPALCRILARRSLRFL